MHIIVIVELPYIRLHHKRWGRMVKGRRGGGHRVTQPAAVAAPISRAAVSKCESSRAICASASRSVYSCRVESEGLGAPGGVPGVVACGAAVMLVCPAVLGDPRGEQVVAASCQWASGRFAGRADGLRPYTFETWWPRGSPE